MSDNWNFDMTSAPRGEYVTKTRIGKNGKLIDITTFTHKKVILCGSCGTVTVSRWMPDEERWEMFSKKSTPVAWHPYPDAPIGFEVSA